MLWQRLRYALLVGAVIAALGGNAWADDAAPAAPAPNPNPAPAANPAPAPAPAAAGAPCGGGYQTIYVNEWVPETYTTTRTVYRQEWREQQYTAYRYECVPQCVTKNVTCYRTVTEWKDVVRTCYERVPVCVERTVMKKVVTCQPCTKVIRKCVDRGHWECCEVPTLLGRIQLARYQKNACCDPCACPPCIKTRTQKHWVSCPVWEECCVTVMQQVCTYVPTVVKCTEWKCVPKCVTQRVCCTRCVPECRQITCTVMVQKCIPYQACRKVCVCVPCCEQVTCCRMVCRCVAKQVPVCAPCCTTCCETSCCCQRKFSFRRHGCCN
jgi:hypothetical protein